MKKEMPLTYLLSCINYYLKGVLLLKSHFCYLKEVILSQIKILFLLAIHEI